MALLTQLRQVDSLGITVKVLDGFWPHVINKEQCEFRRFTASVCQIAADESIVEKLFESASEEQISTKNQVLDVCQKISSVLEKSDISWREFTACLSKRVMEKHKQRLDDICENAANASSYTDFYPTQSQRLTYLNGNSSKRAMQTWLDAKYRTWNMVCGAIERTNKMIVRRRRRQAPGNSVDEFDLLDGGSKTGLALRQEYRVLTPLQRARFHAALNQLKQEKIDNLSKYDLLVIYHTPTEAPGAHWGPAFLPFHREILKQLEVALRQVDPGVALPYWDSTLDDSLDNGADSILWTEIFLGNGNGEVTTGDFANWDATHELAFLPGMKKLYRQVGELPYGGFYRQSDIDFFMSKNKYAELTACVDPTFELVHGLVHMFVGGYMADIDVSPNDPSFFLHHTFVDSIWEQWRNEKQMKSEQTTDYPDNTLACTEFHHGDNPMKPFLIKNKDGLSNVYTSELYTYQARPSCENNCHNSPYLVCNQGANKCVSRIQVGGSCSKQPNACYKSACISGRCTASDTSTPMVTSTYPTTSTSTTSTSTTSSSSTTSTSSSTTSSTSTSTTTTRAPSTSTTSSTSTTTSSPTTASPSTTSSTSTTTEATTTTTTVGSGDIVIVSLTWCQSQTL